MKAILDFARAIADETCLRIAHLAADHWISEEDLERILQTAPGDLGARLQALVAGRLLKLSEKADPPCYRLRKKAHSALNHIASQAGFAAKSDPVLKGDAKAAKQLRDERRQEKKSKPKGKGSSKKAKKAKPAKGKA